ncbi:MAG: hypothetical protein V1918_10690 [Planctomycetota bacterium]
MELAQAFLIFTVDVEADNQWGNGAVRSLRNIPALLRLADSLASGPFPATYLASYEVAADAAACDVLRQVTRDRGEIGAHFHPWATPPDDPACRPGRSGDHPFPSSLPDALFSAKFEALHQKIADVFGRAATAYRAGRLGVHPFTLRLLEKHGYRADSSVLPLSDWSGYTDTSGGRGPSFVQAPLVPYHPDAEDVAREGDSPLLEAPITVAAPPLFHALGRFGRELQRTGRARGALRRLFRGAGLAPRVFRFFPRTTVEELLQCARWAVEGGSDALVFHIHSSELCPGASPYGPDRAAVERLFERIGELLARLKAAGVRGETLSGYAESFARREAQGHAR